MVRREEQDPVIVGGAGKMITDVTRGDLNLVSLSKHVSDSTQLVSRHQKTQSPNSFSSL